MPDSPPDSLGVLRTSLDTLAATLAKSRVKTINSNDVQSAARGIVQQYFRLVRPELVILGLIDGELSATDSLMQELLQTANEASKRLTYTRQIQKIKGAMLDVELRREFLLGQINAKQHNKSSDTLTTMEQRISEALLAVVPSASLSYVQAVRDIRSPEPRISYRGTANDLREALRDILDHMAPDDKVIAQAGFQLEKDRNGPTQRQKVAFVLGQRGISKSAMGTAEGTTNLIVELIGKVTRATYERSSVLTHVASAKGDVARLKSYLDAVLVELLEIGA